MKIIQRTGLLLLILAASLSISAPKAHAAVDDCVVQIRAGGIGGGGMNGSYNVNIGWGISIDNTNGTAPCTAVFSPSQPPTVGYSGPSYSVPAGGTFGEGFSGGSNGVSVPYNVSGSVSVSCPAGNPSVAPAGNTASCSLTLGSCSTDGNGNSYCTVNGCSDGRTVECPSIGPAPTVSISVNPSAVAFSGTTNISWSSANASSCTASGDWSGTKATSGSETSGNFWFGGKTFNITCSGTYGRTASASASASMYFIPDSPSVSISGDQNLTVGQTGTWNYSVSDGDNDLASWRFYASTNPGAAWTSINGGYQNGSYSTSFSSPGDYVWMIDAKDTGGRTDSKSITVHVIPAPPTTCNDPTANNYNGSLPCTYSPTVSITSPSPSAQFNINSTVSISASASDADGTVANVQFFVDGVSIGTVTTAPYSKSWVATTEGSHSVKAVATDNSGLTKSDTIHFFVTKGKVCEEPTATNYGGSLPCTWPPQLCTDSTALNFNEPLPCIPSGKCTDPSATNYGGTPPCTYPPTTCTDPTANNYNGSLPCTYSPIINITSPSPSAQFALNSTVSITASASDADGTVANVQFFVDGTSIGTVTTAPYSASWVATSAGSHSVKAVATDNSGLTKSDTIYFFVTKGDTCEEPTATNVGGPLPCTYPPQLCTDPTALNFNEPLPCIPNGNVCTDPSATNYGGTKPCTYPPPNVPPTVSITLPIDGTQFNKGTNVTITANASDSDGTVSSVEFFVNGTSIGTVTTAPYSIVLPNIQTGAYSLMARATDNKGATTDSKAVAVTAKDVCPWWNIFCVIPSTSITATPKSINGGDTTAISWVVSNADTCTASGGWSGPQSITGGTVNMNPSADTVYTITCTNGYGSAPASVTVTVGGASFCQLNPSDPSCTVVPPPLCTQNPSDPSCLGKTFCELNPTDPTCITSSFCQSNPADPSCGPGSSFCSLHPTDPSCIIASGFTVTSTESNVVPIQFLGDLTATSSYATSSPRRIEVNPVSTFSDPVSLRVVSVLSKSGKPLPSGTTPVYNFDNLGPMTTLTWNSSLGRYVTPFGIGSVFTVFLNRPITESYSVMIEGTSVNDPSVKSDYVLTLDPKATNPSFKEI